MRYTESSNTGFLYTCSTLLITLSAVMTISSCDSNTTTSEPPPPPVSIVINSLLDESTPAAGIITLRSALADADPGERITFDPSLNGETINLTLIDAEHTILTGEVMGFDDANNIFPRRGI